MNLFSGMTDHEVVSTILEFVVFNGFVVLTVIALAAFYVSSRPRRGRVLTASLWHVAAACLFMVSLISTVWAAPAEKSFINSSLPDEPYFDFSDPRMQKFLWGAGFAAAGILFMLVGAVLGSRQRRRLAEEELLAG
jgi:fucose 4-O-acetylase-like acetyltransferase